MLRKVTKKADFERKFMPSKYFFTRGVINTFSW
jgi:hypothetical protein